jgi:Pvc16 N-terminal domain
VASYSAVRIVAETFERILTEALATIQPGPPVARLHDLRPQPSGSPPVLALFFYEIVEDATMRNRPRRSEMVGSTYELRKPAVPLILRFLLVPYAGDRAAEFEMLGRTIQVLHQRPIRLPADLPPALATSEGLAITLAPLTLEERTRVWWSISQPYRLSLNYEIRVVEIDPDVQDAAMGSVASRQADFAAPDEER